MELSFDTVKKILDKVIGEGDYQYCSEYGEPGYSHSFGADTPIVVLSDYWCRCGKVLKADGTSDLHTYEYHHPRIWRQMESQGVQFEWCDEWFIDYEADKAYRTQADSYSWQPSLIFTEDGDMITPESDIEDIVEWAKNNPSIAIPRTIAKASQMVEAGFVIFANGLENGWYPGQNDDPKLITEEIRKTGADVDIVFTLDTVGQFDAHFSVWIREVNDNDD